MCFIRRKAATRFTIKHSNGFQTGYAHLSKVLVKKGEKVKRGSVIALSGNTGRSTGPHVHLTLRNSSGALIDPAKVIYSGVG
jgi:murein DD-endopeptidase MepM/ murein hydrolase activator NlpD